MCGLTNREHVGESWPGEGFERIHPPPWVFFLLSSTSLRGCLAPSLIREEQVEDNEDGATDGGYSQPNTHEANSVNIARAEPIIARERGTCEPQR
jgi:hypothetical protein